MQKISPSFPTFTNHTLHNNGCEIQKHSVTQKGIKSVTKRWMDIVCSVDVTPLDYSLQKVSKSSSSKRIPSDYLLCYGP